MPAPSSEDSTDRAAEQSFAGKVAQHWDALTAAQRTFLRFAADNQQEVAVSSAGKLSRRLGVSTSTIVRSAIVLGYRGFPDLQRYLQQQFFARSSLASRFETTKHEPHMTIVCDQNTIDIRQDTITMGGTIPAPGTLLQRAA